MASRKIYYSSDDLPNDTWAGSGCVYLIGKSPDGPVKVGIATNPRKRVKGLECANGERFPAIWISPLCRNYWRVEELLHERMVKYRAVGEWFRVPFPLALSMALACKYNAVSKYERITAMASVAADVKPPP